MNLRPEEISTLIKDQIKNYRTKIEPAETGTVILFGDGIAKAHGLRSCVSVSYTHLTLPTTERG